MATHHKVNAPLRRKVLSAPSAGSKIKRMDISALIIVSLRVHQTNLSGVLPVKLFTVSLVWNGHEGAPSSNVKNTGGRKQRRKSDNDVDEE